MEHNLTGVGVALVTPFGEDMSMDFEALQKLIEHVSEGVDYLVVCGTTGESATLSNKEKNDLLQFILSNNTKGLPVVFGIGGNNTAECLHAIDNTDLTGVAGILSVSPYYNKPSQEGIIRHFQTLADHSPKPLILYNVPGRTSSNLNWKTTTKLAKHENIIGIKEASGDFEQCMRIVANTDEDFLLISGDDLLTVPLISIGGKGVISVLANAFPLFFHELVQSALSNDFAKASALLSKLVEINPLMYIESNPVGVKEVLSQKGICSPEVRLPLVKASETLKNSISQVIDLIKG